MKEPQDTPDPSGEPIAIDAAEADRAKTNRQFAAFLAIMSLGAAGAFTLISLAPKRLAGAASSARLNWEQRQSVIEKSIAAQTPAHLHPQPTNDHE